MDIRQQVVADLKQRATLLPEEIAGWRQMTTDNRNGMGIHRSQVEAIDVELKGLDAKQQQALQSLDPAQPPVDVAAARFRAERQLSALHGIASIFRNVFLQRQGEEEYRRALRAADLIAADCYKPAIELAEDWGVIAEGRFRPPPLTFLNALAGPAAFTRRSTFGVFKVPLEAYSELKLPISLVSLPFHYIDGLWAFCSLYHEVGHPLDQDLEITTSLTEPLTNRLTADGVAADQIGIWKSWLREIVADAFGVLFGGEAYARSLVETLFLPESEVTQLNAQDVHPNPYVRIFLLGALLRRADATLFAPVADELEGYWKEVYGEPAAPGAYLGACAAVAEVMLDEPLPRLENHRLRDFAPDFTSDRELTRKLTRYLGQNLIRPNPADVPFRLVPAAAQMAALGSDSDLPGIQARGLDFIDAIPQPTFLGGGGPAPQSRTDYFRDLVDGTDFSTFLGEEP